MPHVTRLRVVGAAVAAGALTFGSLATATAAQAGTTRRAIAHTHPAWAVAAKRLSSQASGTVTAKVYLAPSKTAQLATDAAAVSDPGSSQYRHFRTAAEVTKEFAPSAAEISAVRSWLTSSGLSVTRVSAAHPAGAYIAVRGSLAAAGKAFGVSFATYRAPGGQVARAPESAATAPASVASSVLAVAGLDTAKSQIKPSLPPPGPNYWVAGPCSSYYGQKIATGKPKAYGSHQSWNVCGYTPKQVRGGYGVAVSGMSGKGQTVAVVDAYASPTMRADANEFAKVTGMPKFGPGQYQQYQMKPYTLAGANQCDAPGWYGEETLDVESVHDMAPGARVRFVAAASCEDPDLLAADGAIVTNDLASIVSNSWGEPTSDETLAYAFDYTFELGALEGIGFFFSSGDSGYEGPGEDPASPYDQVDYPTSSPYVTSVGGTSLAIGKSDNYEWETSWGTPLDPLAKNGKKWANKLPGKYPTYYDGSSGGGVSTIYPQPAYQAGVVPTSLAEQLPDGTTSSTPMRVVPDVSALADPSTGILVGQTTLQPNGKTYAFSLSRIGGTSVSCPTFAGIEADAQQAYDVASGTTTPIGFANPLIYYLDTHNAYGSPSAAFHDVTDHPLGPGYLAQVRNNYTNPDTKQGPLITYLRTLGIDGEGADALPAVTGYDDSTGVGSPASYIQDVGALG
ncbi:MAG TPA: S53 family peptidase [Streptosporangiaceae bacterium]|nr:S53 family peptidase [Streptosporangiaceae bacterium]